MGFPGADSPPFLLFSASTERFRKLKASPPLLELEFGVASMGFPGAGPHPFSFFSNADVGPVHFFRPSGSDLSLSSSTAGTSPSSHSPSLHAQSLGGVDALHHVLVIIKAALDVRLRLPLPVVNVELVNDTSQVFSRDYFGTPFHGGRQWLQ